MAPAPASAAWESERGHQDPSMAATASIDNWQLRIRSLHQLVGGITRLMSVAVRLVTVTWRRRLHERSKEGGGRNEQARRKGGREGGFGIGIVVRVRRVGDGLREKAPKRRNENRRFREGRDTGEGIDIRANADLHVSRCQAKPREFLRKLSTKPSV